MVLDSEKARTFDCNTCDYNLQIKRNCSNYYESTNIVLNDQLYKQCPRSLLTNQRELRYLVDLYFECKQNKTWPYPGSSINQTAFTHEFFDYIDSIVNIYHNKKAAEQAAEIKKSQSKSTSKIKTK